MKIQLRNVLEEDLLILYDQQLDSDATFMAAFPSKEWESFHAHWIKILADDTVISRIIEYNSNVAGYIVSFEMQNHREVGYWLEKEFWGKNIATSGLQFFLLIDNYRPLYGHVVKDNIGFSSSARKMRIFYRL